MPSAGLEPTAISFNSVLDAYARAGDLATFATVLREMAIGGGGSGGGGREGGDVVGGVVGRPFRSLAPNEQTLSIAMKALSSAGHVSPCSS
jgi:pentatricopeptide repeat protein